MTERQIPSKQIEWLINRGYKYDVTAGGKVLVLRDYVKMRFGMPVDDKQFNKTEPDFSSL